jgi:cytochrome c oxidase subunit 2
MKHLIIAGILVIVVAAALIFGLGHVRLLPEQASAQAVPIDRLFHLEFSVIAILFSLIVVLMVYSIVVFRRKPGDTSDARHIAGNTRLEVAWTIAPLVTVMALAVLGGQALSDTLRADPKALEIKVIAQQWSWRFEYPQYGIVSNSLYLPKDKQVILHMSSLDVIHSFWVPEFRVKQDALPGGDDFVRDLRLTATQLGEFKVRCAELCGLQHAYMEAPVVVVTKDNFDTWAAEQSGVSPDPVVRGEKAADTYGCLKCHSTDGSKIVGPTWKGLFGSQVTLADGTTVSADETYLRESILNPGKQIVAGYPAGVMPATYNQQLNDNTINDIIAYIMSLK